MKFLWNDLFYRILLKFYQEDESYEKFSLCHSSILFSCALFKQPFSFLCFMFSQSTEFKMLAYFISMFLQSCILKSHFGVARLLKVGI